MIDLGSLSLIALKIWTKKRVDEFLASQLAKDIRESRKLYDLSNKVEFDGYGSNKVSHEITAGKYGATVDRKVGYLFAKDPTSKEQSLLDSHIDILKDSATRYYVDGSVLWVKDGDDLKIMNDAIVFYKDVTRQEILCVCRKIIDVTVASDTGAETQTPIYEIYFNGKRCQFVYEGMPSKETDEKEKPVECGVQFFEIGKTGDVPLFTRCKGVLRAYERIARHQDHTVEHNTTPLTEIRGYSGTDPDEALDVINRTNIALTNGTGGVTIHSRSMDSASVQVWYNVLNQLYCELTATVGKDNELQYAQSGKALDRLFVDMESSARSLAHLLEKGLNDYFVACGKQPMDILWNTDKPYDDSSVIDSIMKSRGFVSDATLLERHPYVINVELEKERLAEQQKANGLDDILNFNDDDVNNTDLP